MLEGEVKVNSEMYQGQAGFAILYPFACGKIDQGAPNGPWAKRTSFLTQGDY